MQELLNKAAKLIDIYKFIDSEAQFFILGVNHCTARAKLIPSTTNFAKLLSENENLRPGSTTDKLTFIMNEAPFSKNTKDEDITRIRLLAVDMDKEEGDSDHVHYNSLMSSPIPPHIVLKTRASGRYQAFWRVDGLPVRAFNNVSLRLQKWLTSTYLGKEVSVFDGSIANPSRLMRVPFFSAMDKETGELHKQELIHFDPSKPVYNISDSTGELIETIYDGYNNFMFALSNTTKGITAKDILDLNSSLISPLPDKDIDSIVDRMPKPGRPKAVDQELIEALSKKYVYVRVPHKVLDVEARKLLTLDNLRIRLTPKPFKQLLDMGLQEIENTTFAPTPETFIQRDGDLYFNTFIDRRVKADPSKLVNIGGKMRCEWFNRYLTNAFPPEHHQLIREWLALTVVHPEIKLEWALMFSGGQRAGKSSLFDVASKLFGDSEEGGYICQKASSKVLLSSFNGFVLGKLLIGIDELAEGTKTGAYDQLKTIIGDNILSLHAKNKEATTIRAYHNFIVTTNSSEPIKPEKDDRKLCVIGTREGAKENMMPFSEWNHYLQTGMPELMAELQNIEISLDTRHAPHTQEKLRLMEDTKTESQLELDDYLSFLRRNNQTHFIPAVINGRGRVFGMSKPRYKRYLKEEYKIGEPIEIPVLNRLAYPLYHQASKPTTKELEEQDRQQRSLILQFRNNRGAAVGLSLDFNIKGESNE